MSFPVFSPQQVNLNAPDPRLMVTDWAGAFNRALESGLNAYVKMKGLGLEERYKQHIMEKDDLRFQLDQRTAEAKMANEKMQLESALLTNETTRKANETADALNRMKMKGIEREANAVLDLSTLEMDPDYVRGRTAVDILPAPSTLSEFRAAEKKAYEWQDAYGSEVARIGFDNPAIVPTLPNNARTVAAVERARDRIFTGETLKVYERSESDADLKTVAALIDSGAPQELIQEAMQSGGRLKTKITDSGKPELWSVNRMETELRNGSAKAMKVLVQTEGVEKAKAILEDLNAMPTDIAGKAWAAKIPQLRGTEFDVASESAKTTAAAIAQQTDLDAVIPGGVAIPGTLDPATGKPVMVNTKRDLYRRVVDAAAAKENPAGVALMRDALTKNVAAPAPVAGIQGVSPESGVQSISIDDTLPDVALKAWRETRSSATAQRVLAFAFPGAAGMIKALEATDLGLDLLSGKITMREFAVRSGFKSPYSGELSPNPILSGSVPSFMRP